MTLFDVQPITRAEGKGSRDRRFDDQRICDRFEVSIMPPGTAGLMELVDAPDSKAIQKPVPRGVRVRFPPPAPFAVSNENCSGFGRWHRSAIIRTSLSRQSQEHDRPALTPERAGAASATPRHRTPSPSEGDFEAAGEIACFLGVSCGPRSICVSALTQIGPQIAN